ncbi:hypothetical protein V6N13_039898 [Hibiscus sabdariffa]
MGHYTAECRRKGHDDEAHLTCATDEEPSLMMTISQEGTHVRRVQEDVVLLNNGKGTIVFECGNGDQKALQEVYYIPKLCSNIISLGKMRNKVQMAGDTMKVSDKRGKLLMSVKRTQNRLYKITLKTSKQGPRMSHHLKQRRYPHEEKQVHPHIHQQPMKPPRLK